MKGISDGPLGGAENIKIGRKFAENLTSQISFEKSRNTIIQESVKPGLHIVITIAECACDNASNRILKL